MVDDGSLGLEGGLDGDLTGGHGEGELATLFGELDLLVLAVQHGDVVQHIALIGGHSQGDGGALGGALAVGGHIAVFGVLHGDGVGGDAAAAATAAGRTAIAIFHGHGAGSRLLTSLGGDGRGTRLNSGHLAVFNGCNGFVAGGPGHRLVFSVVRLDGCSQGLILADLQGQSGLVQLDARHGNGGRSCFVHGHGAGSRLLTSLGGDNRFAGGYCSYLTGGINGCYFRFVGRPSHCISRVGRGDSCRQSFGCTDCQSQFFLVEVDAGCGLRSGGDADGCVVDSYSHVIVLAVEDISIPICKANRLVSTCSIINRTFEFKQLQGRFTGIVGIAYTICQAAFRPIDCNCAHCCLSTVSDFSRTGHKCQSAWDA